MTVAKEEEKSKENRVDLEQVVGECLKATTSPGQFRR